MLAGVQKETHFVNLPCTDLKNMPSNETESKSN